MLNLSSKQLASNSTTMLWRTSFSWISTSRSVAFGHLFSLSQPNRPLTLSVLFSVHPRILSMLTFPSSWRIMLWLRSLREVGGRTEGVPAVGTVLEIGGIVLLGEVLRMRRVIIGVIPRMTTTATVVVTRVTTLLVVPLKCLPKLRHGSSAVLEKRNGQCMCPRHLSVTHAHHHCPTDPHHLLVHISSLFRRNHDPHRPLILTVTPPRNTNSESDNEDNFCGFIFEPCL